MTDLEKGGFEILRDMFKFMNIHINELKDLIGIEIERDLILTNEVSHHLLSYQKKIKESGYKTGTLTSLHKNNNNKQKWPEINIVRQLLKCNKLKLQPFVKSNGYDKQSGKKKVIRWFRIISLPN